MNVFIFMVFDQLNSMTDISSESDETENEDINYMSKDHYGRASSTQMHEKSVKKCFFMDILQSLI